MESIRWYFQNECETRKTTNGTLDGVRVNGTSEWTAVFGAEYNPNEFWSFVGRGIYTGRSPVMNEKFGPAAIQYLM